MSRQDRVHTDSAWTKLARYRECHCVDGAFGRCVHARRQRRVCAQDRTDIYDTATGIIKMLHRFVDFHAVLTQSTHTKIESTVRYLGIEVDDALEMAEQTEV